MFTDGEGNHTASCVFDPGMCLHTCCVRTSLYSNFKNRRKGLQKQRWEEVRVVGATP